MLKRKTKRNYLPQLPARIEQELIDKANEVRLDEGLTWTGFARKMIRKTIQAWERKKKSGV